MMENGYGNLTDKFYGLGITDSSSSSINPNNNNNDSLFQVMKAVEAAEATIKQQVEENNQLRSQLFKKTQELEKYKSDETIIQDPHSVDPLYEGFRVPYKVHHSDASASNQDDRIKSMATTLLDPRMQNQSERSKVNGALNSLSTSRAPTDNAGFSQFSPTSTASFSPSRYHMKGEHDQPINLFEHGSMPLTEVNDSSNISKQDILVEIRKHEEEMILLRKLLTEYSIKEAQVRNEKYVLEKRIAHMRLAFDQQQQDLVDAASKALSYRQDIIEENIRLTYALQDAQQERSTFISSLLPLLAEYSLQPSVPDAQSIVSNVKVLFKHMQEKLILTEAKLKESQYQLMPWHSDVNTSNFSPLSPSRSVGAALMTSNKKSLELVHQPIYSNVQASSSDAQTTAEWDFPARHQNLSSELGPRNMDTDEVGMYSPIVSRNAASHDAHMQFSVTHDDSRGATQYGQETGSKQVKFSDPVSNSSEMEHHPGAAQGYQRESWSPASSPYNTTTIDEPTTSYSPFLPPVLEEPSSSFSEAADDDPLPAIEGLQISGETFPGQELQACGYSINGTTSCNFEWVRHWEDGSVNYIEGAKQPNYLVTADDVHAILAIEVQPLDNRKRKGKLVKVFANDHRKITCDPEMQSQIEKTHYSGHATYKLALATGYFDIWEPATLAIKREGYSIKRSGPSGVIITEKFSPSMTVTIPYGQPTEFLLTGSNGDESLLRTDGSSTDSSCSRDTIVLTLRLFIGRANEKKKGKKRSLFFNK